MAREVRHAGYSSPSRSPLSVFLAVAPFPSRAAVTTPAIPQAVTAAETAIPRSATAARRGARTVPASSVVKRRLVPAHFPRACVSKVRRDVAHACPSVPPRSPASCGNPIATAPRASSCECPGWHVHEDRRGVARGRPQVCSDVVAAGLRLRRGEPTPTTVSANRRAPASCTMAVLSQPAAASTRSRAGARASLCSPSNGCPLPNEFLHPHCSR